MVLGALANSAGLLLGPAGPRVALGRGHHARSDHRCAPAAALQLAQPQRGLLLRRHAGVARGRPDHPRGYRRRARARRFRQGVLRHERRRLGRADLRFRRRRRDAERGLSLRLGGLPRHALPPPGQPAPLAGIETGRLPPGVEGRAEPLREGPLRRRRARSTCSIRSASRSTRTARSPRRCGAARRSTRASSAARRSSRSTARPTAPTRIKAAITAAKDGGEPIELLVKRGERYLTVPVDYHGGLRWPWLEPRRRRRDRARPPAGAADRR